MIMISIWYLKLLITTSGGKNRALQFSKSGDKKLEEAYSRHYLWNQSPEKKQEIIERAKAEQTSGADGV